MTRNRTIQLVCVLVAIAALVGAALMTGPISDVREHEKLTPTVASGGAASPFLAVTTVLAAGTGVFRGVAIDIAWYRANQMKEQGKYYESNALAQWIAALEPHYATVWVFQAWNMAYNISVATYTPEERWNWVNKGVRLLRDRGIPLNPTSVVLYKELGWIFFHKIGESSDDMHWYYKRQLAIEWQELLGAPPDSDSMEVWTAPLRAVVAAPDRLEDLVLAQPDCEALLKALAVAGYQPNEALLREMGKVAIYRSSSDAALIRAVQAKQNTSVPLRFDPHLADIMDQTAYAKALPALLAFLRKDVLVHQYHMDPAFMLKLMAGEKEGGYDFGPIDWRHPATHSLYWDTLGTKVAQDARGDEKIDLLNTYRGSIHSLQSLTRSGRVNFDPISGYADYLPDPRFIPSYEKAYLMAVEDLPKHDYVGNVQENYAAGYENFLLTAIEYYYLYGSMDKAREYFDKARRLFGKRPENIQSGRYSGTIEELAFKELSENKDMAQYTRQFIDAMLLDGLRRGLANGRMDVFDHYVSLARKAHTQFNQKAIANPNAPQNRMALLPFEDILTESYIGVMQSPSMPMLVRVRIWRNTPLTLQQRAYDRLRDGLTQQCQAAGLDMALAFPEPVGMGTYRKAHPATARPPEPGDQNPFGAERK